MNEGWAIVLLILAMAGIVLTVLVLIAVGVSFLVPVDLSIAVLAVLTACVVEYMLLYVGRLGRLGLSDSGFWGVQLIVGTASITGVFVAGAVLGPGPVLVGAILAALGMTRWVLATLGSRPTRQEKAHEEWRARPEFGPLTRRAEPEPGTPEEAMTRYLVAWTERDFDTMSWWTWSLPRRNRQPTVPKRLEELYGLRDLADFSILKVRDTNAYTTQVTATLTFASGNPSLTMTANVIFGDDRGDFKVRGTGGRWGVNETSALQPRCHRLGP